MNHRFIPAPLLVLLLAAGAGCGDSGPDIRTAADTASAAGRLRVLKGDDGPEVPSARLAITSPAPDEVVSGDTLVVRAQLTGMDLGSPTSGEQSKGLAFSPDGQHLHVIIDNEPYKAMYQTDAFAVAGLSPGVHTLRAFPSRSWHESFKGPGLFVARTFYMGRKEGGPVLDSTKPLLTYSRPRGEYNGEDARRILLDFYVTNATLAPDQYKVLLSIDGKAVDKLTQWVPWYIEGLADGPHEVRLQLLGPDDAPVPGPFNDTEREIVVQRGGAPADHASH